MSKCDSSFVQIALRHRSKCSFICVIKLYFTNIFKGFIQRFSVVLLEILPTIEPSINPNIMKLVIK